MSEQQFAYYASYSAHATNFVGSGWSIFVADRAIETGRDVQRLIDHVTNEVLDRMQSKRLPFCEITVMWWTLLPGGLGEQP